MEKMKDKAKEMATHPYTTDQPGPSHPRPAYTAEAGGRVGVQYKAGPQVLQARAGKGINLFPDFTFAFSFLFLPFPTQWCPVSFHLYVHELRRSMLYTFHQGKDRTGTPGSCNNVYF